MGVCEPEDCLPFSRMEEEEEEVTDEAVVRPRTWGADVESAESVERERLTGSESAEGRWDELRTVIWRRGLLAAVVVMVVDEGVFADARSGGRTVRVAVEEEEEALAVDEGRRFRLTMLDHSGPADGVAGADGRRGTRRGRGDLDATGETSTGHSDDVLQSRGGEGDRTSGESGSSEFTQQQQHAQPVSTQQPR
jgi:hypothetical protein